MHYPLLITSFILFFSESIETCSEGCSPCIEDKCVYCKEGYYGTYEDGNSHPTNCFKCQLSHCKTCIKSTQCESCEIGYYLKNSNCEICDSNCKTCTDSKSYCTSCEDGKNLSKAKCLQCNPNCKTCKTTAIDCLNYNDGYYLSSSNTCLKCPDTCKRCNNENKCTLCNNNYFLYNNECLKCNINCKTLNDYCKYNTCKDGYYLNNFQCLNFNSLCKTCSQPDLCTQCINDYHKIENDPLNTEQNFKCYKDPSGYYLDNDIYKKCYQSCKKCNKGEINLIIIVYNIKLIFLLK